LTLGSHAATTDLARPLQATSSERALPTQPAQVLATLNNRFEDDADCTPVQPDKGTRLNAHRTDALHTVTDTFSNAQTLRVL